jgi:hypothetical protein
VLGFEQSFNAPQTFAKLVDFLAKLLDVGGLVRRWILCGLRGGLRNERRKQDCDEAGDPTAPPDGAARLPRISRVVADVLSW